MAWSWVFELSLPQRIGLAVLALLLCAILALPAVIHPFYHPHKDQVTLENIHSEFRGDHVVMVSGMIKNLTSEPISYARITFYFHNSKGELVATSSLFAVGGERLMPGESREYERIVEDLPLDVKEVDSSIAVEWSLMRFFKVVIIGLLMATGIVWQMHLFAKDSRSVDFPDRMKPAVAVAIVMFLGIVIYTVIAQNDPASTLPWWMFLANAGKAIVLAAVILGQAFLAPIVGAYVLSWTAYHWLTYGEFHSIPIIQTAFEWALAGAPPWAGNLYACLTTCGGFGGAIHDSRFNFA